MFCTPLQFNYAMVCLQQQADIVPAHSCFTCYVLKYHMLNLIVSYWQAARIPLYEEFSPLDSSIVAQEKLDFFSRVGVRK